MKDETCKKIDRADKSLPIEFCIFNVEHTSASCFMILGYIHVSYLLTHMEDEKARIPAARRRQRVIVVANMVGVILAVGLYDLLRLVL